MRCDKHGLACGPDGRCVLCRKEGVKGRGPSAAPPAVPARRSRLLALIVGGVLLVAGAALGARAVTSPTHAEARPTIQLGVQGALAPVGAAPAVVHAMPSVPSEEPSMVAAASAAVAAATTSPPSWREASRDVHVVVYTTGWCPHCREAKVWLNANGVAYEERDIEASSDNARKNRSLNPRGSIPTFDVEGDVMVGFSSGDLVAMIERAAQRHTRRN